MNDSYLVDELRSEISILQDRIEDLKNENRQLSDTNYSLEFRIRNELEPRIQAERNSYDRWATDPRH